MKKYKTRNMELTFNVEYRTQWGESLFVGGNRPELGNNDLTKALPMKYDGAMWTATVDEIENAGDIEYFFFVKREDGSIKREWGKPHILPRPMSTTEVCTCNSNWQDQPWDKPYYSSALTECVLNRPLRDAEVGLADGMVTVKVQAPMVHNDEVVALCGEAEALGLWDPAHSVRMSDAEYPIWTANIDAEAVREKPQFKFLILKKASGELVAWEGGENREINPTINKPGKPDAEVREGLRLVNPLKPWKGAGTAIPVFSLRSEDDCGVGDFMDLIQLVDWAKATGQNFIQVLPINDTTMTGTWTDSYPYNANSTFALHPMYLRLQDMGRLDNEERRNYYSRLRRELNSLPQVDYERVNKAKIDYSKELYQQIGTEVLGSKEFKLFFNKNENWLVPYAAFCVLRDIHGTPDMGKWGEYSTYSQGKVNGLIAQHIDEVNLVYFMQFFLDKQMRKVRDYAHSQGVALKGDIPIGISRTSVDAWVNPRLFNLDCQAGAPPDAFSTLGQNWGFPTYNWEEMGRDGFAWWKARFCKMAEYFDAYRIDHILGFFRIWQIPMDAVHGLLGVFHPALPFTPDELRYSYDFWLDVNLQTTPYIMDWFLGDFFGDYADEARDRFLEPLGYGRYKLRETWDTQRKVVDYFATQEQNEKNAKLRDALLGLIDQVLFIEDPYEKGKYHPRISAQFTYIYRNLNDYERYCFDRLYNDFFYRRHNEFWYGKAMWKLPPLIDSTQMLVCGEDLGMIPDCVPAVMRQLEILTLEIQRMPKDPKAPFGNTWDYPYFSVCTTSTHDMDGIRRWWEAEPDVTQRYYNEVLHEGGKAPQYAEPWICEKILKLQLDSPSMLAILPLQDWLSIDGVLRRQDPREELINVPANSRHYWRYRMHITLESLLKQSDFNTKVLNLVKQSGR